MIEDPVIIVVNANNIHFADMVFVRDDRFEPVFDIRIEVGDSMEHWIRYIEESRR